MELCKEAAAGCVAASITFKVRKRQGDMFPNNARSDRGAYKPVVAGESRSGRRRRWRREGLSGSDQSGIAVGAPANAEVFAGKRNRGWSRIKNEFNTGRDWNTLQKWRQWRRGAKGADGKRRSRDRANQPGTGDRRRSFMDRLWGGQADAESKRRSPGLEPVQF